MDPDVARQLTRLRTEVDALRRGVALTAAVAWIALLAAGAQALLVLAWT